MVRVALVAGLLAWSLAAPGHAFVTITQCGQAVPAGQSGDLTVDLSCPVGVDGVLVGEGAVLRLNGHRVAGASATGGADAVRCTGVRCTVRGPGRLVTAATGIRAIGARLAATDVVVSSCGGAFVGTADTHLDLTNASALDTSGLAIDGGVLKASNVSIVGAGAGIRMAKRVRAAVLYVAGTAGVGVDAPTARFVAATITGCDGAGVLANRVRFKDSQLTGNGLAGTGVDIESLVPPRLRNSTCDRSQIRGGAPGTTWGRCLLDLQ